MLIAQGCLVAEADLLLTTRQTAQVLGVNINTVRAWADKGKLPCDRNTKGEHRKFRLPDVQAMAAQINAERS